MSKFQNRGEFGSFVKIFLIGLIFVLFFNFISAANIPQTFNIHGKLTNSVGVPITTSTSINFSVYNVYTGGTAIKTITKTVVPNAEGIYDVILDGINLGTNTQYYLGIKVGTDAEMTPRINLTSVPYAYYAQNVSVSGIKSDMNLNLSGYKIIGLANGSESGDAITWQQLQAAIVNLQSGGSISNINASQITTGTLANARLVGSGQLTVTAGTGLTGGGAIALGASKTISLNTTYTDSIYLNVAGDKMSGTLNMSNNQITGLANGTTATDAVTYSQLQAVNTSATASETDPKWTANWTSRTGSGNIVYATSPTLTTPNIGAATGTSLTTTGNINGSRIISTVASGTAPFVVNSNTVVTNLNADLWDGQQFASYLNQAVLNTSSPKFAGLNLTGNVIMNSNKITGLANGTDSTDAVTKAQLDAVNTSATASETDPKWTGNMTNVAFKNSANTFGAYNQTFDTNTLFIDSTNNKVGIGTTSPTSKLTVDGNLQINGEEMSRNLTQV